MFKVIVVDDEPPILNAIARMIEQTNSNFKVVGKALNGEDALILIKDQKPDVVFTDVKMPVMDGLQLIENLMHLTPKPVCVILSGYKEFEYAKKALHYGAFEYLIKPLNLDILKNLLDDIFKKLYQTKKSREIVELENMVNNSASFTAVNMFDYKKYICLLLCAGSYCSYHSSSLTPGKDFWIRESLENLILANLNQLVNFWVIDGEHENEKIALIGSDLMSDIEIACIPTKISDLLNSHNVPLTIITSVIFESIDLFGTKVHTLQNILKKYIVFGSSQLIAENKLEQIGRKDTGEIINPSWKSFFSTLILNRQKESFKQNIRSFLTLCESKLCRQLILEKILQEIYGLFCKKSDLKLSDKLIDIQMELNELITYSTSYQLLFEGLSYLTEDLFDGSRAEKTEEREQQEIIERIDDYIKSNYSKPINLQTLSAEFGLVPQYLGRKYKNARGMTPNDFILQLRIEKSKELLSVEPPITIKDIAEAIGYEDPFYLSRIFKIVTGKSPSEFRSLNKD